MINGLLFVVKLLESNYFMKIYIGHFIDYNFKEKEQVTKPYYSYNALMYFCMLVAETFPHIGFWIEDKEI